MAVVVDYSSGQPGAAAIAATTIDGRPVVGAMRYVGFPNRTKCTTAAELADFTAHRLGMGVVFEDSNVTWRGGYAAGADGGRRARAHATALGFPTGRPIYMAIDQDVVTEAEFQLAMEFLRGAASTVGGVDLTGPYGEYDVCVRAARDGVGRWFWQCRAWSGTPVRLFPGRHLFQRAAQTFIGGVQCDINDVLQTDWGQHLLEDDMTPEQARKLDNLHAQLVGDDNKDGGYGSTPPDNYPGWPMPDGTRQTLVTALAHIFGAVDKITTKVDAIAAATGLDPATLAKAVADEEDRRRRDGDPTTGPVT